MVVKVNLGEKRRKHWNEREEEEKEEEDEVVTNDK